MRDSTVRHQLNELKKQIKMLTAYNIVQRFISLNIKKQTPTIDIIQYYRHLFILYTKTSLILYTDKGRLRRYRSCSKTIYNIKNWRVKS